MAPLVGVQRSNICIRASEVGNGSSVETLPDSMAVDHLAAGPGDSLAHIVAVVTDASGDPSASGRSGERVTR